MTSAADADAAEAFAETLGAGRVARRVRLDRLTTFRTGGEADWLLETRSGREVARAIGVSRRLGLPVTFLGGGSNVLIGERGVRGLVVRVRHGAVGLVRPGVVRAAGGVTLNGLVRWSREARAAFRKATGSPSATANSAHSTASPVRCSRLSS